MRLQYNDYSIEFQIIKDNSANKFMFNTILKDEVNNTSSSKMMFLDKVEMLQLSKFIELSVNNVNDVDVKGKNYGQH